MFGAKHSQQDLHHVKHKFHQGYRRAKEVLGRLDDGVQTIKHVQTFIAPLLNHTREGRILNEHLSKATHSYDTIRNHVANADRTVNAVARVVSSLQKQGFHIGL